MKQIIKNIITNAGFSRTSNNKCKVAHPLIATRIVNGLNELVNEPRFSSKSLTTDGGQELKINDHRVDIVIEDESKYFNSIIIEVKMPISSIGKNIHSLVSNDYSKLIRDNNGKHTAMFFLVPDTAPNFSGEDVVDIETNLGEKFVKYFVNENTSKYKGTIFLCVYNLNDIDYGSIKSKKEYDNILKDYSDTNSISLTTINVENKPSNLVINDFDEFVKQLYGQSIIKYANEDLRKEYYTELLTSDKHSSDDVNNIMTEDKEIRKYLHS